MPKIFDVSKHTIAEINRFLANKTKEEVLLVFYKNDFSKLQQFMTVFMEMLKFPINNLTIYLEPRQYNRLDINFLLEICVIVQRINATVTIVVPTAHLENNFLAAYQKGSKVTQNELIINQMFISKFLVDYQYKLAFIQSHANCREVVVRISDLYDLLMIKDGAGMTLLEGGFKRKRNELFNAKDKFLMDLFRAQDIEALDHLKINAENFLKVLIEIFQKHRRLLSQRIVPPVSLFHQSKLAVTL